MEDSENAGPRPVIMNRSEAALRKAYYCNGCKQLRGSAPDGKMPQHCAACCSSDIVIDNIDHEGMKRLYMLRYGTETPFGVPPPPPFVKE